MQVFLRTSVILVQVYNIDIMIKILARCYHPHCGAKVPLRFGPDDEEFDAAGWGRCQNCKAFIFRKMLINRIRV